MRRFAYTSAFALLLVFAATLAAAAAEEPGPTGRWDRDDGLGGIEIDRCGDALCGHIVWLRNSDTPAHVGQQVLFDMRATGADTWSGSAVNPEDGRTYSGTMTLLASRLLTRGCLFGGLICRSVALSRPHS